MGRDHETHPLDRSCANLPSGFGDGETYFVTVCLQDAVPVHLRRRHLVKDEGDADVIAAGSEPPTRQGSCLLRRAELARVVENTLIRYQRQRYDLHAWVVMPNHVHVVVNPAGGDALSQILHFWKSFTSNELNRLLDRTGELWQEESFEHLIGNEDAYARFVSYVELNPVAAGLCHRPGDWPFSSARHR
jgi:REP element-mobilizing transposase RayT